MVRATAVVAPLEGQQRVQMCLLSDSITLRANKMMLTRLKLLQC